MMLRFETPIGTCGVRWSEVGITSVLMPGSRALAGGADVGNAPGAVRTAVEEMLALLAGEARDLRSVAVDLGDLDPFRRAVYVATRKIGPGRTSTYGEIAQSVGVPDGARAVGAALASNPVPIVVPCHRVLAADGALHGFSAPGGLATKRRMLEIEGAPGFRQEALFA
jgi:methylated-DNA-[protein]-cysteine S-methyltransferase